MTKIKIKTYICQRFDFYVFVFFILFTKTLVSSAIAGYDMPAHWRAMPLR